ncbi:hypothetical protein JCM3770_003807 [Rhodotorula araucariae]
MADSDDDGYSTNSDSEPTLALAALQPGPQPDSSAAQGKATKGKGKGNKDKDSSNDKEPRKRSSKACDNCRKSKCKCTRILDPASGDPVGPCQNCLTVGADCTFLGASRKRGPPKGYIEAIESRLHRMEALLGGLLGSDDPRAATLLGELIGDSEARDILARDLKAATTTASSAGGAPPKRSWKREFADQQAALARSGGGGGGGAAGAGVGAPILSTGFPTQPGEPAFPAGLGNGPGTASQSAGGGTWLSEEDLAAFNAGGQATMMGGLEGFGAGAGAVSSLGFDPASLALQPYRGAQGESSEDGASPAFSLSGAGPGAFSLPVTGAGSGASAAGEMAASPRQRRRLDLPTYGASPGSTGGASPGGVGGQGYLNPERKQMAYAFTLPPVGAVPPRGPGGAGGPGSHAGQGGHGAPVLSPGAIGHTGTSSYLLASAAGGAGSSAPAGGVIGTSGSATGGTGAQGGEDGADGNKVQSPQEPLTELADVVGQLSLNENAEVRYHGRSSGLYLISKSQRFKEFFWRFPSAGVWPPADHRVLKTEGEILRLVDAEDPLPDMTTQTHLLAAYWTYVHPHFPLLYKISFMRQYRHSLAHPHSTEPSTPAGTGKVPVVLLLCMFALAARYCDLEEARTDGKYWTAGQEYLDKARRILNHDYGSSKLVTVQALLLISYREIGVGAMSSAWMTCGMAIRMAQDLGLFRDVEKWYLPIQRFTHEEKQGRKRVWWACVILDRYTSSYIGRPGTIHERDYDCGFPSEDEPDEHEQWRPIRLDGTEWTSPPNPKSSSETLSEENAKFLRTYPPTRAHTLSCFNAAGALAVIINRIISNIYAIRIRVLGQSSETLLSLLDQSLASWYLALPPHLQYNPASKKVPPPHILSLHLQFYSSLILLHRPFIPGQHSTASPGNFPSHSICTTSANAIANIITTWSKTFTLRQCPPFLTYPIFSAAIICVYNASFDEALARPAKAHLLQCMNALKEMELIWGSAIRQWELLHGLVDLRDADLRAELDEQAQRGTKRATMDVDDASQAQTSTVQPASAAFEGVRPTNFHNRPLQTGVGTHAASRAGSRASGGGARKRSSTSASRKSANAAAASPTLPQGGMPLFPGPVALQSPPVNFLGGAAGSPPVFAAPLQPAGATAAPGVPMQGIQQQAQGGGGLGAGEATAQSFDILNPQLDLSQFKSRPGSSNGAGDFSDLLNSFLSPTEAAGASLPGAGNPFIFGAGGTSPFNVAGPSAEMHGSQAGQMPAPAAGTGASAFDPTSAFFGMPLGANLGDDWFNYSYNAFASTGSDQGGTPESQGAGAGAAGASSMSPPGGSNLASLLQTSPKPPTM